MSTPTTRHPLQTLLQHYLDDDCELRSYSGRGMCGERCLAISGSLPRIMRTLVEGCLGDAEDLSAAERTDVRDAMDAVQTDSLGRGQIVYFPGVPYVAYCDGRDAGSCCDADATETRGMLTLCLPHAAKHDAGGG
jgi:hypothetical protein